MNVITSVEFLNLYPEAKSVAFVGNAPSLREENLGDWIDQHDIVVRFNEAPVDDFQQDVGSKTSILVSNPYPNVYTPTALKKDAIILIISPQTRRPPAPHFETWAGENKLLFSYTPDILPTPDLALDSGLSTGTYGIHLLSRLLKPSRISITGFTMFLDNTSHHYWSDNTPQGSKAHDFKAEAPIFISLVNRNKSITEVTEDISWVSKRIEKPLDEKIAVRSLKNRKWKT